MKSKSIEGYAGKNMPSSGSSLQSFEELFKKWAMAAMADSGYSGIELPQHGRIPTKVKSKVVDLWDRGIIYSDTNQAYFCIADRKNGNGSRYKWFNKGKDEIVPNWEYFRHYRKQKI